MSEPIVCRSCGTANDASVDFCQKCGEYLRWDLTRAMPAAIELQGATPAAMPIPAEAEGAPEPDDARSEESPPDGASNLEAEEPPAVSEPALDAGDGGIELPVDPRDPPTLTLTGPRADRIAEEFDFDGEDELAPNTGLLTAVMPALGEPGPAAAPSLPVTGGATLVVRSVAATELEQGEAAIGSVDAGSSVTYEFMLRNVSTVVDNYDLVVAGLPEGWATVVPDTAYLVPYGSGGSSDQLVRVTITPPRTTDAEARVWPFELVALSRADGGIAARTPAGAEVGPFSAWELSPLPAVKAGRLRGRYVVTVANLSNAPIELWMYASEAEDKLHGRYLPAMLALSPGERRTSELTVRPPRPRLLGRTLERYVALEALPDAPEPEEPRPPLKQRLKRYVSPGGVSVGPHGVTVRKPRARMPRPPTKQLKLEDLKRLSPAAAVAGPAAPTQVTFRHKALIPTWLILLALLCAAAIAAYLLTRTHRVAVPALVGLTSSFAAQQKVQQRGLTLNPTLERDVTSAVRPGTIVAQYPEAGKEVKRGTQVTLEVAVGTGMETVPNLKGDTRATADTALRKDDLSLGAAEPVTAPLSDIVSSQIPQAGVSVAAGTAIQIYLTAPPSAAKTKKKKTTSSSGKSSSGSTSKPAGSKPLTVPAVAGETAAKAEAAVRQAGLVPEEQYAMDATTADDIFAAEPAAGTVVKKGSTVTLYVSLGEPDIAFDNGTAIQLVNSQTGKSIASVTDPDGVAVQPSFSPDGAEFVYRSNTRVFVAATAKPSKPVPIYQGSYEYTDVTFSLDTGAQVLALDRQVNGVGELCLAQLSHASLSTSCLPDDSDWDLDGPIAWSPDGEEILAYATSTADANTFGLVEYTTKVPFSTNAANWSGGTVQTDVTEPGKGVLSAAFAPDGKEVALVNNLTSSQYEVSLVASSSLDPTDGLTLPIAACQVAWQQADQYLAVLQGNATCTQSTGTIMQVSLADTRDETEITTGASDVTYQSLDAASVSH